MFQFKVESAMGSSVGSDTCDAFVGRHHTFFETANNRADAFIQICRRFAEQGYDVTALRVNEAPNPLNFSTEDLAVIDAAGILLKTGSPKFGYVIEDIIPM